MVGGPQVARALARFYGMAVDAGITLEPVIVNGQPGFRSLDPMGRVVNVVAVEVRDGVIVRVLSMLNPDKLGHLGPVSDVALRPSQR
jgi:RNA polymerase sigma-70 factor (ECF subfamily)